MVLADIVSGSADQDFPASITVGIFPLSGRYIAHVDIPESHIEPDLSRFYQRFDRRTGLIVELVRGVVLADMPGNVSTQFQDKSGDPLYFLL